MYLPKFPTVCSTLIYSLLLLPSSSELELTWDPLIESCHEMILAEQSLISDLPFDLTTPVTYSGKHTALSRWRECFKIDSWVKSVNEDGAEMPLSYNSITESSEPKGTAVHSSTAQHIHVQSDIPSLNLVSDYRCKPATSTSNSSRQNSLATKPQDNESVFPSGVSSKDQRSAAWEILELSNSRVSSRSSSALQFFSSSLGNTCSKIADAQRTVETFRSVPHGLGGYRNRQFSSPVAEPTSSEGEGELGSFMMMRYSELTPKRGREGLATEESDQCDSDTNGGMFDEESYIVEL